MIRREEVVEVNVFGSRKLVVASAVGGGALLLGGLFAGSALVSAQEPSPTPGTEQQQQTPAPQDGERAPRGDGTTPKSREECEKDGAQPDGSSSSSSSGSSSGVRGSGAGNGRYF
jgi:hypothetical protein